MSTYPTRIAAGAGPADESLEAAAATVSRCHAVTYGNGSTAPSYPTERSDAGWISKWRWYGPPAASPVLPTNPITVPAGTRAPSTASGANRERCA
jgi:hypothetical protein